MITHLEKEVNKMTKPIERVFEKSTGTCEALVNTGSGTLAVNRQCNYKAKWLVEFTYDTKKLCTRHKNVHVGDSTVMKVEKL